jgi:hypothetical protein
MEVLLSSRPQKYRNPCFHRLAVKRKQGFTPVFRAIQQTSVPALAVVAATVWIAAIREIARTGRISWKFIALPDVIRMFRN